VDVDVDEVDEQQTRLLLSDTDEFALPPDDPDVIIANRERGLLEMLDTDAWEANPSAMPVVRMRRNRLDPVQVWMRHPTQYPSVVQQRPYHLFTISGAWRGSASRTRDDVDRIGAMLPPGMPYRVMTVWASHAVITDVRDGERTDSTVPAWTMGQDPTKLLRFCNNAAKRGWERIVVSAKATPRHSPGRLGPSQAQAAQEWLFRVMSVYPEITFHLHNSSRFRWMFGSNYSSADFDPNHITRLGRVMLPNGSNIHVLKARENLKWIHVLGYSAEDLRGDWQVRTQFSFEAALWAAVKWNDPQGLQANNARPRTDPLGLITVERGQSQRRGRRTAIRDLLPAHPDNADAFGQFSPDPEEPYAYVQPVSNTPHIPVSPREKDYGDKIVCDSCSLARTCKVFREGSVCGLSSSPASSLAQMFGTRDAHTVRNALGAVLAQQADRYARSVEQWREDGSDVEDLRKSEHLMKMENSLTKSGEALVKLLDPSFRDPLGVPAIQNNTLNVYNPRVLVADVVKQLEAAGVQRADIDPAMIVDVARERGMIE
jgi:hypothetical protein